MALETMQGNWTSSRGEGGNLMFFLKLSGNLGFPLELNRGCSFNTHVFSAKSGCLSSFQGHLGIILELWQGSRDTPRVEEGDPGSLSSYHWDIRIPIDFQEESGIVSC